MAPEKKEKKENKIVVGILLLVIGIVAIAMSGQYVWMLFNVIELPLWLLGGIFSVIGVLNLVQGIKEKKNKEQA